MGGSQGSRFSLRRTSGDFRSQGHRVMEDRDATLENSILRLYVVLARERRKRDWCEQFESLSDLSMYQGLFRAVLYVVEHRGARLQDRGGASGPIAAGAAGDGAGGGRIRLRGADRGVRRHLRPAAVGYSWLHAYGLGVRAGGHNPQICCG